jgi:hypothetical protein
VEPGSARCGPSGCCGTKRDVLELLTIFLAGDHRADERREALGLRGTIRRDLGDVPGARSDLREAQALSEAGSYSRYTIQVLLAGISLEEGDAEPARAMYLEALETVVNGSGISAGSGLSGLL